MDGMVRARATLICKLCGHSKNGVQPADTTVLAELLRDLNGGISGLRRAIVDSAQPEPGRFPADDFGVGPARAPQRQTIGDPTRNPAKGSFITARRIQFQITLFKDQVIRDTVNQTALASMYLGSANNWAFWINNDHNQPLTLQLMGCHSSEPGFASLMEISRQVPANSKRIWADLPWSAWQTVRANYATAPTTGTLSIDGLWQEEH